MRKCGLFFVLGALALNAVAAGEAVKKVDVPAGDLVAALQALATQAQAQFVFSPQDLKGARTRGVQGAFTAEEAVVKLLEGTQFRLTRHESGALLIQAQGAKTSGDAIPADQMRMAQVSDSADAQAAVTGSGDGAPQVVVQGERDRKPPAFSTNNLDLTRTEDDALPFLVFDAKDIELSGAQDLQKFLQDNLPQNFNSELADELYGDGIGVTAGSGSNPGGGAVDMRGWGAGETVFLLNGIRMPKAYTGFTPDLDRATPDLRGIALASIERIEILGSAAGAIYGAGATGGVINIITRRDFSGGQAALNYSMAADGHAPARGFTLNYGMPLRWGLAARMSASYDDSEPLQAGDRAAVTIDRWRQLALTRDPARLFTTVAGNPLRTTSTSAFYGATPNIRAADANASLFSGVSGAPVSNFTTVPAGSTGNAPQSAYRPGIWNIEQAAGSAGGSLVGADSYLGQHSTARTATLGVDKNFGERWTWSVDGSYSDSARDGIPGGQRVFNSTSAVSSPPSGPLVPGSVFNAASNPVVNPFSPFAVPVRVYLVDPDMPSRAVSSTETWTLSSTLRGQVGEWRGFLDLRYSENTFEAVDDRFVEPIGGWRSAFTSGRYNPFVDTRVAAPAAPEFYEHYIMALRSYHSMTTSSSSGLKISGPLFRLPAGQPQLTLGAEVSRVNRREFEAANRYVDSLTRLVTPTSDGGTVVSSSTPVSTRAEFESSAAYAEFTAPLLSDAQGVPLVRQLELYGSGRTERMESTRADRPDDTFTNTGTRYAYGLRYAPLEGATVRVTRSIGVKPPTFAQVVPNLLVNSRITGLEDPRRDGQSFDLETDMYFQGGNPDLIPETTTSTNVGIILTPPRVKGLRFSVDYVESLRDDVIWNWLATNSETNANGIQALLNLESELPGLVRRDDDPSTFINGVGPITFLDLRYTNLRQIFSRSVDFSVDQRWEDVGGGRLVLALTGTRNLSYRMQSSNSAPAAEQVRNRAASSISQQVAWRGNVQLRWERPTWSVGWKTRYYDYLLLDTAATGTNNYILLQGADRAPRELEHDLNFSYRAPSLADPRGAQWLLSGTSFAFGVNNVFDRAPRFWAASTDRGVAPFDSIQGRSLWLRVAKDFH